MRINFPFMVVSVFEIAVSYRQFWISVLEIETTDFNGALFYMECDNGWWKFDVLWMRELWWRLK